MEKLKKYWKEILIALLLLFGMNKCTSSCNRGIVVKKQTIEIQQKDSVIKTQTDSLNILKIRWNDAQTSQTAYQGLAMGNQQDLINQVEQLTSKVNALTAENGKLKTENVRLKKQIKNLQGQ